MGPLLVNAENTGNMLQDRTFVSPHEQRAAEVIEGAGYDAPYVMEKNIEVDLRPEAAEAPGITDESLLTNQLWIDASRRMKKMFGRSNVRPSGGHARRVFDQQEQGDPESDAEIAQWGLEFMGWFNYNLPKMGMTAHQVSNADGGDKLALYYMMDLYDKKNISWDGTKRMFKGILTDPTTYVGLTTLGIGAAAGFGAKQAGKQGLLAALRAGLPAAALTGIEGGVYTSLDDAIRQSVEIGAGAQDEFDVGRNLTAGAVGTGAAMTLGAGAAVAPELVRQGARAFEDTVQAAKRGTMFSGVGPVKYDNPGGSWLKNKQEAADKDIQEYAGKGYLGKGLGGSATAYVRNVDLPVSELKKIPGAADEKRIPGDFQYDQLTKSVEKEGFRRDSPILIGVNHKGEPYIIEGNTRVAVAADQGIETIPAEVQWKNGGELIDGSLSPSVVERLSARNDVSAVLPAAVDDGPRLSLEDAQQIERTGIMPGMSEEQIAQIQANQANRGSVVQPTEPLETILYREPEMPDFRANVELARTLPNEELIAQRKGGLLPFLHETAVPEAPIGGFVKKINRGNADRAYAALDEAAARHTDPASSPEAWSAYQADLLGKKPGEDTAVSLPPYQLIRYKNNPDDLVNVMAHTTPEQIGMAKSGLDAADQIGAKYAAGQMDPETTAEMLMWGMLSRQKSAFPHEAAFLDLVAHTDDQGRSLRTFVDKAAQGQFGPAEISEYLDWAKGAMPADVPGRAAIDNINAFGKNMLPALAKNVEGESVLMHLHNMISDPNKSGREIRREFFKLAEGSGIDNKVLSFVLLLTGRKDVMVLDRIQFNHMWNDGRFGDYNLYTPVSKLNPDGTPALTPKGKPQMMSGSTISDIGKNAYGLMVYEAMERELEKILPDVYAKMGREYRGIGEFHWESWVLTSQQEAAHPSLAAFTNRGAGGSNLPPSSIEAGAFSREGRFDAAAYGAKYGRDVDGKSVVYYPGSEGVDHMFTPEQFKAFLKDVTKPSKGVVYEGFKVSDFSTGTTPWVKDERINRQKLDELIKSRSTGPVENF